MAFDATEMQLRKNALKARSHDGACLMRLSFWRMKTTANASISVDQLVASLHTFTQFHTPKSESHPTFPTV